MQAALLVKLFCEKENISDFLDRLYQKSPPPPQDPPPPDNDPFIPTWGKLLIPISVVGAIGLLWKRIRAAGESKKKAANSKKAKKSGIRK